MSGDQPIAKPTCLETPDLTQLKALCQQYIDEAEKGRWPDEDLDHYIFEAAITALYGQQAWQWIRAQNRKD